MRVVIFLTLLIGVICPQAHANQDAKLFGETLLSVQTRWAEVNFTLSGNEQIKAFNRLINYATETTKRYPQKAEIWTWLGIVQSSAAGADGSLGALPMAKDARKSLQHALKLDSHTLSGTAMTTLGVLYHRVPGWPISFGSDKKAKKLLTNALVLNPKGIDINYFYAEFLFDNKEYELAEAHLKIAEKAPIKTNQPVADRNRRKEIETLLAKVSEKLSH